MNISIKKLDFKRAVDGSVPFTEYNISLLLKYVIPVISKNPGWSTDDLDEELFLVDPEKWRDDIDAIILNDPKGEVYVALDGRKPAGLLGYIVEDFDDLSEKDFSATLEGMVRNREYSHWEKVLGYDFLSSEVLDKYHSELEVYFRDKRFYKGVAVVLVPSLQGKKSGISDLLFEMMSNGVIFGWTSTPLVIAKFNKLYRKAIFFPLLEESIKDLDE